VGVKLIDIKNKLGKKYKVIRNRLNNSESIKVFFINNGIVDQEIGVELVCNKNLCEIFEIQREKKYSLGTYNNKEIGYIALYFAVISIIGPGVASNEIRERLLVLGQNDLSSVEKTLNKYVGKKYYSFFDEVKGAINLKKLNSGNHHVYYLTLLGEKIPIVNNVEAPTFFLVMYNFGIKLKQFDDLLGNLVKENLQFNLNEIEKIKRLFLRK